MKYANGDTYAGDFKIGKRDGEGIKNNADGSWYKGSYKDDLPHGQGEYQWVD